MILVDILYTMTIPSYQSKASNYRKSILIDIKILPRYQLKVRILQVYVYAECKFMLKVQIPNVIGVKTMK